MAEESPAQGLRLPRRALERLEAEPVPGGHPMEIWISYVLRIGVLFAAAIIGVGVTLLLIQGPGSGDPTSVHDLRARGGRAIPVHPSQIFSAAFHLHPTAIIQVGVLALILTPVWRVAMTVFLFIAQRDRFFVVLTAIVLGILVLGLTGVGS